MNRKMQWLRNKLLSMDLQGMIVSNPVNIRYLTNIQAEGILLVTRKENIFLTDSRYIEDVHNTLTLFDEIVVYDMRGLSIDDYENFFMFCENVGFEENYVTYAKYKEYMHRFKINNFVETENMIEKQRMIKDEEEIESIQKACKVTDDCFEYILGYIKPGMTEKQIAREIDDYYYKNAEGTSFDTIVASGENSSKPHAVPTDRKIQEKDIITIDMGCKIDGYCSDMTRTFFVGEVPEEMKKVYDLVLKNQVQTLNDHAADHRDHGGQAGEGRGAGGADDGDGAVGQQKGQCGAADAQIQAGGQKAAAGKGQGQILRHRSVDAVIHQGADGEEHRPRQAHEIGLLHGGIGRQLAVVDEINDVAEHGPEQQHIAQGVEGRAGPLQQSDDDDARSGQQDAAHLKFTGHLVEEQRRGQHREDGDARGHRKRWPCDQTRCKGC